MIDHSASQRSEFSFTIDVSTPFRLDLTVWALRLSGVSTGIPIVTFGPATEADLEPGATFFVPAQRGEDGSLETKSTHRCKAGKPNRSAGQSGLHDYLCLIEMLPKKGVTISVYLQRRWRFL